MMSPTQISRHQYREDQLLPCLEYVMRQVSAFCPLMTQRLRSEDSYPCKRCSRNPDLGMVRTWLVFVLSLVLSFPCLAKSQGLPPPSRRVRRRSSTKKEDARADRAGNCAGAGSAQNCGRASPAPEPGPGAGRFRNQLQ